MASRSLYVMSPTELAWGYVFGNEPAHEAVRAPRDEPELSSPRHAGSSPRLALESVIRSALLRPPCGVIWPPMIHVDGPLLDLLGGGSLIDGEGGDEVLGVDTHRIAPITRLA